LGDEDPTALRHRLADIREDLDGLVVVPVVQDALDEVSVVTRWHGLEKIADEDLGAISEPLISEEFARDVSCTRQLEDRPQNQRVRAQNVGQDIAATPADINQSCEPTDRKTGGDARTFGPVESLHEARQILAACRIGGAVLTERLPVDLREY